MMVAGLTPANLAMIPVKQVPDEYWRRRKSTGIAWRVYMIVDSENNHSIGKTVSIKKRFESYMQATEKPYKRFKPPVKLVGVTREICDDAAMELQQKLNSMPSEAAAAWFEKNSDPEFDYATYRGQE